MPEFTEVAERVWVARYPWVDVNITAIGGERGLVIVDTHGSTAAGREVVEDLRRLGAGEVAAVVNTHWHWDHTFGNAAFRAHWPAVPIHAQESAARWLAEHAMTAKRDLAASEAFERIDEVQDSEIVIPDHTVETSATIDLGDRVVELIHPGRGHTDGDLVVRVMAPSWTGRSSSVSVSSSPRSRRRSGASPGPGSPWATRWRKDGGRGRRRTPVWSMP